MRAKQSSNEDSSKIKPYKPQIVFLISALLLLFLTYLPLLANEHILDLFVREDAVFEDLTAIYLFLLSLLFVVGLFRFWNSPWMLRLSYAGLALLFFLGAGEEVSWGERIFDWDDHNYIKGINVQHELTLHNLKYFQGDDAVIPVSASQVFTAFAIVITFLIPLACRFFPRIREFLMPRFPVLPLEFGLLVVITYIFQKSMLRLLPLFPELYHHPSMPFQQGVHEIREHGYAFALLVSTFFYFLEKNALARTGQNTEADSVLINPVLSTSLPSQDEASKT